jgi:hypothetical protein
MNTTLLLGAVCALLLAVSCNDAQAAQGDVYIAAHRTRDGSYVPANVPPSSGGARPASALSKGAANHRPLRGSPDAILAPIFIQAKVTRR